MLPPLPRLSHTSAVSGDGEAVVGIVSVSSVTISVPISLLIAVLEALTIGAISVVSSAASIVVSASATIISISETIT